VSVVVGEAPTGIDVSGGACRDRTARLSADDGLGDDSGNGRAGLGRRRACAFACLRPFGATLAAPGRSSPSAASTLVATPAARLVAWRAGIGATLFVLAGSRLSATTGLRAALVGTAAASFASRAATLPATLVPAWAARFLRPAALVATGTGLGTRALTFGATAAAFVRSASTPLVAATTTSLIGTITVPLLPGTAIAPATGRPTPAGCSTARRSATLRGSATARSRRTRCSGR
jgi:hypothetical protein